MGERHVCKGLLLDEKDAEEVLGETIEDFDHLCEVMSDLVAEENGWTDYPQTNALAVASERFNIGRVTPGLGGAEYVRHDAPWNATISHSCCSLSDVDAATMDNFLIDEDVAFMTRHLKQQLQTHLDTDEYEWARAKLIGLENLADAGLPGFQSGSFYSRGGETGLFDMRHKNHGRGTRVFFEIEHVW